MSWLKNIRSIFKSPKNDRNYWIYVKCDHCGEALKSRVDMFSDLSIQYGEGKNDISYYSRKVLVGSKRCYRPIEVEFTFDAKRNLVEKQISGGKFLSEDEYNAILAL